MVKVINYSFACIFKFSFFFEIGLWILIGWVIMSSEGLRCYFCEYLENNPGNGISGLDSDPSCLDPIKNNAPTRDCDPDQHCMKYTIAAPSTGNPKTLGRKCSRLFPTVGEQCIKPNNSYNSGNEDNSSYYVDYDYPVSNDTINIRWYCNNTNLCNSQPGIDTICPTKKQ